MAQMKEHFIEMQDKALREMGLSIFSMTLDFPDAEGVVTVEAKFADVVSPMIKESFKNRVIELCGGCKMTTEKASLTPALQELERCFNAFNKALYGGKLPHLMITIQGNGRSKNTLGWFCNDIWTKDKNNVHEINLSAEFLNREVDQILETLLHEMVHFDNRVNEIKDCSANQYHNKKFREGCEKIGLNCEKMKGRGWAYTSLSLPLTDLIKKVNPKAEAFKVFRKTIVKAKGPGSKLKKWTCDCGINIRVAIDDFSATCNNCESEFVLAE